MPLWDKRPRSTIIYYCCKMESRISTPGSCRRGLWLTRPIRNNGMVTFNFDVMQPFMLTWYIFMLGAHEKPTSGTTAISIYIQCYLRWHIGHRNTEICPWFGRYICQPQELTNMEKYGIDFHKQWHYCIADILIREQCNTKACDNLILQ